MLRLDSKNINYSAGCLIDGTQIGYFSGSRNGDNISINVNIDDLDAYLDNHTEVQADIAAFVDRVAEYEE